MLRGGLRDPQARLRRRPGRTGAAAARRARRSGTRGRRREEDHCARGGTVLPGLSGGIAITGSARGAEAPAAGSLDGIETEEHEIGGPSWYLRASAEFSALMIDRELTEIIRYANDAGIHAHNLMVLGSVDPFPLDLASGEALGIARRSEEVADHVSGLRNAVVRYLRAALPEGAEDIRASLPRRRGRSRDTGRYHTRPVTEEDGQ